MVQLVIDLSFQTGCIPASNNFISNLRIFNIEDPVSYCMPTYSEGVFSFAILKKERIQHYT
jgi:hypothetical protein